jgi:CBS-domain-containing membrane protein
MDFLKLVRKSLLQSSLAGLSIIAAISLLTISSQTGIAASLGATCFILFTRPNSYSSKSYKVLGGYILSGCVGWLCWYLLTLGYTDFISPRFVMPFLAGIAVMLSMILMILFKTEHPPAVSFALALAITEWNYKGIVILGIFIIVILVIKQTFKRKMINLF